MVFKYLKQNKAQLEKAKTNLEAENIDMATEIKQLSASRTESERKRKQLEQQVQEYNIRLSETERAKGDASEKVSRLQVCSLTWLCNSGLSY